MRSGYVHLPGISGMTFRNAGFNGYGWSSRGSDTNGSGNTIPTGYILAFSDSTVYPSLGPVERYSSRPLRCLSTVLDI